MSVRLLSAHPSHGPPQPVLSHMRTLPADTDLISAVAAGSAAALGDLYDRHAPLARAVARPILRDSHAEDDCLQLTFLSVWRHAGRYTPDRGPASAWIAAIARNAALDQLRRESRHARRRAGDAPLLHLTAEGTVEDEVHVRTESVRVRAALAQLPPEQAAAVRLVYDDGLTAGEVAARTGVPCGTAKSRIRLGLGRLRTAMGQPAGRAA